MHVFPFDFPTPQNGHQPKTQTTHRFKKEAVIHVSAMELDGRVLLSEHVYHAPRPSEDFAAIPRTLKKPSRVLTICQRNLCVSRPCADMRPRSLEDRTNGEEKEGVGLFVGMKMP